MWGGVEARALARREARSGSGQMGQPPVDEEEGVMAESKVEMGVESIVSDGGAI